MCFKCNKNDEHCYKRTWTPSSYDQDSSGGQYTFSGQTIKLMSTELHLLRGSAKGKYKNTELKSLESEEL